MKTKKIKKLLCQLCKQFYKLGWVSGTGGGISIRKGDKIFVAPSGVQKERIKPEDLFEINIEGNTVKTPKNKNLKLSACTPLFLAAYLLREAGAVIHSHSINAVLASQAPGIAFSISGFEMQKGIAGHGIKDTIYVPIIENVEHEADLLETLSTAIQQYPKSNAVLVRNHGVYVWGDSWVSAKTQAECYDYLFELHRWCGIDRLRGPS